MADLEIGAGPQTLFSSKRSRFKEISGKIGLILKESVFASGNGDLKREIIAHLVPLIPLLLVTLIWAINGLFSFFGSLFYLFGLLAGAFILDLDHLLYWFLIVPNAPDSLQARELLKERQFGLMLNLLGENHKKHTSLIFHHYIFQLILLFLTFFVITSTSSYFGKGMVLAASAHLLVDELMDLRYDYNHLRHWLFARSPLVNRIIPQKWLFGYWFLYFLLWGGMIRVVIG